MTEVVPDVAEAVGALPGVSVEALGGRRSNSTLMLSLRADQSGQAQLFDLEGVQSLVPTARPDRVPVLINLKRHGWDRDVPGLAKGSRLGTILSALATEDAILALADDPGIVSVEASRGGFADCTHSMPFIGATSVHAPPLSETGAGAIVAVIDEGIDVLHGAFHDHAGQSRILFIWDQSDSTGPTPAMVSPAEFASLTYGTLHSRADINQYIASGAPRGRLRRDPGGHGTHVASIAAGTPLPASGFPGGVAPGADLVIVIPKLGAGPGDPQSLGYSLTHVDALTFVRAVADQVGSPVAVNVSLGMNAGAHDGSSLLENAFDAFSGGGRHPGYAIVKSAGNEFGHGGHAFVQAFQGGVIPVEWTTTADRRKEDYIEFWFSSRDDLMFTLNAPTGLACTVDRGAPDSTAHDPAGQFSMTLCLTRFNADNGDSRLLVLVRDDDGGPVSVAGEWRLDITGNAVFADGGVHGWVERDRTRAVQFRTGSANDLTLSIPATARSVIAVGACASKQPLTLSASSSRGPTRDARQKPELVAPGVAIIAAKAGTLDQLVAMTGTSMAAPHVTGAVALLMARRVRTGAPQLNAAQIRSALGQTVSRFNGHWQAGFGSGRLDVIQLLDAFS